MHHESKPLSPPEMDMHIGLHCLADCVEEIDAYMQKAREVTDPQMKSKLLEACADEKAHVAYLIEWLCKRDNEFSKLLYTRMYAGRQQ